MRRMTGSERVADAQMCMEKAKARLMFLSHCRVSDTMAGACLGVFLTGAAANFGKALRSRWSRVK